MNYLTNDVVEHSEMNNIYKSCKRDGVTNGLEVTQDSPLDMSVNVSAGSCFIGGIEQKETGITNITITAANATNPRKDIIVYDDSDNNPIVVTGLAATIPVIPNLSDDQILLAIINVIANETEITNSEIKDRSCWIRSLPTGLIVMWSGSSASIPYGWKLCDGTNSTPDLQDRFIVGAGSTYAVDATGGATTHDHTDGAITGVGDGFSASTNKTNLANHLPPYYALCYIMKD